MLFFFDLHDPDGLTTDENGVELASAGHARREAAKILAEIALHQAHSSGGAMELRCTVRCDGAPLFSKRLLIEDLAH